MLKATIDRNENACKIELKGSSLELSGDLSTIVKHFTKILIIKNSKGEARKLAKIACSAGIALALEEEQVR